MIGTDENGTEKNGVLNNEYCRDCCYEGSFTYPKLTWREIKTLMSYQARTGMNRVIDKLFPQPYLRFFDTTSSKLGA